MANGLGLTREGLLLLLVDGASGSYPIDPVRLMKGAFLVVERGRPEWKYLFDFQAYDYGPFDATVYDVRDTLIRRGLFRARAGRYEQYGLTDEGREEARRVGDAVGADADWIRSVGRHVSTRSFKQLLEEIYSAYPYFRARSVYRS